MRSQVGVCQAAIASGVWLWFTALSLQALPPLTYRGLDAAEDPSAWSKGDPITDLQQHDAAVTGSTELAHEGQRALVFMIRVNWAPRPGEAYAKGWPMMRRVFASPQDWSAEDVFSFWIYPRTTLSLRQEPVLRLGFPSGAPAGKGIDWFTIPGLRPNTWQEVTVPLDLQCDWRHVQGISFYVAEGWYQDGDQVDFFIDDMRLGRYTAPGFAQCDLSARSSPRGAHLTAHVRSFGPVDGARLRIRGDDGAAMAAPCPLAGRDVTLAIPMPPGSGSGHRLTVELLDAAGAVADSRPCYVRAVRPGKRCYLQLISFYTKPLGALRAEELAVLNDSAYQGVSVPLLGSYSTEAVPALESLLPAAQALRDASRLDLWPWVSLNRMIGSSPTAAAHTSAAQAREQEYFRRIRGLDLGNEAGARADFLAEWRLAVRLARTWRAPGVTVDFEAYNDYSAYQVPAVAEKRGESVEQVIGACRALGAEMAMVIGAEYPGCIVWSLFSRLEHRQVLPGSAEGLLTTPSYITLGLLEYARDQRVPLRYLCGGETTPGYCSRDLADLQTKIRRREVDLAPYLERFPDHFDLAGTVSPFHDFGLTTGWIRKGYENSSFRTLPDQEPLFRTLFDAYDWVWIYASSAARTEPYTPANNRLYTEVFARVLQASLDGTPPAR